MTSTFVRGLGLAAVAGTIALLGSGVASAAPAGAAPVAVVPPVCPSSLPYSYSCHPGPDGLTLEFSGKGGNYTENYDKLGNFVCTLQPGLFPSNIPCTAAVAAVHALPPLPIGEWFRSASQ